MKLSKKRLAELRSVSVFEDVLKYYGYTFFENGAPDTWSRDDTKLYDMLVEVESGMTKAFLKTLGENPEDEKS